MISLLWPISSVTTEMVNEWPTKSFITNLYPLSPWVKMSRSGNFPVKRCPNSLCRTGGFAASPGGRRLCWGTLWPLSEGTCNKTNPFLPFNDHIFLLYELVRSFWLPYRLPLLSCEVRLLLEGTLLVRWPYHDLLLGSCQETVPIPILSELRRVLAPFPIQTLSDSRTPSGSVSLLFPLHDILLASLYDRCANSLPPC